MYMGRRPNAAHGTATNSHHPCDPVAASSTMQPPATEAHETKLERALRTISGSPVGASCAGSRGRRLDRRPAGGPGAPRCAGGTRKAGGSGSVESRGPRAAAGPRLSTLPEPPAFRVPPAHRGAPGPPAGRRSSRRPREPAQLAPTGEPDIVRKARSSFVSWASVAGGCMVLDAATGSHGWWLFVAVPWAAFGLLPMYMKLWNAGYSWRDVLRRPAAVDAVEARLSARSPDLPPARADEFGRQAAAVQQARSDRKAILKIMERLPQSEKQLLPDVAATVDGLLKRAEELAQM